jgi:hypothetical protein
MWPLSYYGTVTKVSEAKINKKQLVSLLMPPFFANKGHSPSTVLIPKGAFSKYITPREGSAAILCQQGGIRQVLFLFQTGHSPST